MDSPMLKVTLSSPTLKLNLPSYTSMTVQAVARNGRPIMIGSDASSSISKITKSTRKMNLSILTNRYLLFDNSFIIHYGGRAWLVGGMEGREWILSLIIEVRFGGKNLSRKFETSCSQLVIVLGGILSIHSLALPFKEKWKKQSLEASLVAPSA
nr:hypothetical protein [Tanacetum cinerariifolium]